MPNSNLLLLVSSIAKAHLEGHEEDPIEEMARIAFRAALNNGVVYPLRHLGPEAVALPGGLTQPAALPRLCRGDHVNGTPSAPPLGRSAAAGEPFQLPVYPLPASPSMRREVRRAGNWIQVHAVWDLQSSMSDSARTIERPARLKAIRRSWTRRRSRRGVKIGYASAASTIVEVPTSAGAGPGAHRAVGPIHGAPFDSWASQGVLCQGVRRSHVRGGAGRGDASPEKRPGALRGFAAAESLTPPSRGLGNNGADERNAA